MPKVKHHDRTRTAIRSIIFAAALGCLSLTAHALAPSKGYNVAVTPDGKNFKIKYASDGTPTATTANGASGVQVTAPASVPLGPLKAAGIVVGGIITGASVGGAVGAAIGGLGALAVATLPGFVELFTRQGVKVNPDGSYGVADPATCTTDPCYGWKPQQFPEPRPIFSTMYDACYAQKDMVGLGGTVTVLSAYESGCSYSSTSYGYYNYPGAISKVQIPAAAVVYKPSTFQQFVDKIAMRVPTQADVQVMADVSLAPQVSVPTVTGPARVFMGNTVEMFSPTEKRTIEEWKNLDYSTPGEVKVETEKISTITTEAKTSTTVTTNPDGSTSTATTTTPATSRVETSTDTDEKPPEDPCKLFPMRAGCLDVDTPNLEMPKETKTLSYNAEDVFGTGSCPANLSTSIATLGKTVTVWDWQKTCSMALPLRALVLALAGFAAILIIMPGSRTV